MVDLHLSRKIVKHHLSFYLLYSIIWFIPLFTENRVNYLQPIKFVNLALKYNKFSFMYYMSVLFFIKQFLYVCFFIFMQNILVS